MLKLPTYGLKKTRTGFYSTNAKVLGDLAQEYQIVADVLEYRERAKDAMIRYESRLDAYQFLLGKFENFKAGVLSL